MFTIRKANSDDCELIHNMALQTWEDTYGKILSPEQLSYMKWLTTSIATRLKSPLSKR